MNIDITTLVLGWIIDYGSPMVGMILLFGAMGVPVPGTLVVIAAGAFVQQELLSYFTPILSLLGAVAGDTLVYGVGRFASQWIENRFGASNAWKSAQERFDKQGGIAIYLTRWLVTPLAVPTNLIAGTSRYSFSRFLFFDVAGELTWIVLFGGLGYTFGDQWALISDFVSNFSGVIVSVLAVVAGIYLLVRYSRPQKKVLT